MKVAHGVSAQSCAALETDPAGVGSRHRRTHVVMGPPLGPQSPLKGQWVHLCLHQCVGLCWTLLSVQEAEMKSLGASEVTPSW